MTHIRDRAAMTDDELEALWLEERGRAIRRRVWIARAWTAVLVAAFWIAFAEVARWFWIIAMAQR
jgi:hypothetical protein